MPATSTWANGSRWSSSHADDPAARRARRAGPVPGRRAPASVPGGTLAVAIAEALETYEVVDGLPAPLPDIREVDGVVYSSQPIAVRADPAGSCSNAGARLSRRRASEGRAGPIRLDLLTAGPRARGPAPGSHRRGMRPCGETADYSGSEVVMLVAEPAPRVRAVPRPDEHLRRPGQPAPARAALPVAGDRLQRHRERPRRAARPGRRRPLLHRGGQDRDQAVRARPRRGQARRACTRPPTGVR